MTPKLKALKGRRREFVIEYLGDPKRNATKAAIRAGYSERTARRQASRLLTFVDVKDAISEAQEDLWTEAILTESQAQALLSKMALQNIGAYMDGDGQLDLSQMALDEFIISQVSSNVNTNEAINRVTVKTPDPMTAIMNLAKLRGWPCMDGSGDSQNGQTVQITVIEHK